MAKYVIGIDYGTLSARALLLCAEDGKEISVVDSKQAGAKGSAIYASVASGLFPSLKESAKVLGDKCYKKVVPNLENTKLYDKQYDRYVEISEFFASKKLQ